jgi:hypothetical protein
MPLNLHEFLKEEFQGYVSTVPPQRQYILSRLLPDEPTYDIDFAYNIVNGEYAQAASITGFSAAAPLRDKKQLSQAFGSVTKIQHAFRLDEREILKFNAPRHDAEKQQVIDYIYNNTDELIMGVDDLKEFMRAQVLYNGRLKYDDDENDIHIDVDFGIPAEHKLPVTTAWDTASSNPLSDIQAAVKRYQDSNQRRSPNEMHMTSVTFSWLLKNEQIKTQLYGTSTDKRLLTAADVNQVISSLGLPPIVINDDVINLYGGGAVQLLADGKVVLFGDQLGKTFIGPTAENNFQTGKFVAPKVELDPPQQSVRVGETAFPALQRFKSIVIMTVK